MVGPAWGRVIDQNTRNGEAPTSRAASSIRRSTDWNAATGIQIMNSSVPTSWISTTPQNVADEIELQENAGNGDEEAELRKRLSGKKREEQHVPPRELQPCEGVGGRQADQRRQEASPPSRALRLMVIELHTSGRASVCSQ